jgi:hypothetical protein
MKRILLAAALASLAVSAHAGEDSDLWFGDGVAWYQHPCGLRAFAKYGQDDSPAVRRAYYITLRDPSQCSKLFP